MEDLIISLLLGYATFRERFLTASLRGEFSHMVMDHKRRQTNRMGKVYQLQGSNTTVIKLVHHLATSREICFLTLPPRYC